MIEERKTGGEGFNPGHGIFGAQNKNFTGKRMIGARIIFTSDPYNF